MKRWLLIFALAAPLMAQNTRWDLPITTVQAQGGNLLPVYAIPGAGIKFYSCSGSVCTTLATTYISATSGTTCPVSPTPMQVTLNGSSTCVSTADPYGNMGAWFQAGQYMATITAQGGSYNYYFTVGSGGGSGCSPNTIPNGCTGATTAAGAEYNLTGLYTVDGSQYASVQAAITACLASANTSCTVDARTSGRLGSAADVIGSFDPGSKGLSLLLGSYSDYTACQVTARNNLSITGQGSILTQITSSCTGNQAMFVLPQADSSPAIGFNLKGFEILPASGATTQIGADLECGSYVGSGMWYSIWEDVWFGNYINGFPGGGIKLSCPSPVSAIQFSQFRNVVAFRSSGETNPALSICGSGTGNDQFYGGEFDAGDWSDTTIVPNVFIGACAANPTGNAYSLNFYGTTVQGGTNLVELNGANAIQFDHTHHEGTPGLTNGFRFVCGGSQNLGIHIDHPAFGNVGTNLATFTGSIAGTTLTVSGSVTGTIAVGAALISTGATGITDGTIIVSGSGTTWTINNSQTVGSEAMTATGYTLDTAGGCDTDKVSTDAGGPIVAASVQSHTQNVVVYGTNGPGSGTTTYGLTNFLINSSSTLNLYNLARADIFTTGAAVVTDFSNSPATNIPITLCAVVNAMNFSNSGTLLLGGATSVSVAPNQCATFAYDDFFQKWTLTGADPTTALSAASGTQVANHTVAYNGTSNQVLAESNAYAGINGAHWGDSGFNLDTDPLSATFPQETISSYTFQGTLPAFGVGDDVICHIDPTGNQVGAPGQIVTENCIDAAQSGATAGQSCWRTYGISAWGTWTCGDSGGAFSGGLGASYQDVTEIAAPSNPASGNDRLYTDSSTHLLGCLTSSGGSCLPSGGSMTWPSGGAGIPYYGGSSAWGTSLTKFGSAVGIGTTTDPGTTAEVPMVADGSHGEKPSASGALGTGAFVPSLSLLKGTYTDGDWCSYTASGTLLNCNNAVPQAALSLIKGTYVDGDLCSYTASGTLLNCNTAPGGTGTVTDGSGTTTPLQFPESTSSAHVLQYRTPTQALGDMGAAPAVGNVTAEPTSWPLVANNIYRFTGSGASNATTPATLGATGLISFVNAGSANVTVVTGTPTLVCIPSSCIVPAGASAFINTDGTDQYAIISNANGSAFGSLANASTINNSNWSGTVLAAGNGGTGVANTATLTLGSSNQNWASLGTGIVKNTTTTGALTDAAAADVYGLWSGTCNSSSYLRGDGACASPGGSGTVTVVGAGNLTSTALVTGGGSQALQTPSATSTLDSSGNLAVAAGGSVGSADTGTPKFTFATNKATFNQPFYLGTTSNQLVTGTTTNLTTLTFPASSGAVTLTFPITTELMVGANSDTTTTHVLHATAVAGVGAFSALASGDIPNNAANTTGSAASLSISGQTGLLTFTGLTSTNRAKTVRDAADTILELGGSYTPTGTWTSMTFVTPALGTPASGVITNLTGTCTSCTANTVTSLVSPPAIGGTTPAAGSFTTLTATTINTTTHCAGAGTAANPSVASCSSAASGFFSCATNASTGTCQVNTTAVTANSVIQIQPDSTLGTALSVTCNTTADSGLTAPRVSARSAGTSFTITMGTYSTNPECFSYLIIN